MEPIPDALLEAMGWIRMHTDPGASLLASADYVAAVGVLGGRRVLRAPALATPVDDERRIRLERAPCSPAGRRRPCASGMRCGTC